MQKLCIRNVSMVFLAGATSLAPLDAYGASGIFESFVVVNSGSGNTYYDLASTTANPDWNGRNLGSFYAGGSTNGGASLTLKGGELKTYQNGTDSVNSAYIGYQIASGGTSEVNLPWQTEWFDLGSLNKQWVQAGQNIQALNTLAPGTYNFSVYGRAAATWSGGSFDLWANNGGSNYTATFTVNVSTFLWDGSAGAGDTSMSTASNWSNDIRPGNGHNIQFAGSASTVTNSLSSAKGIAFNAAASPFTVGGSAISIGSDGVANNSSNLQTINANVTLAAPQTFASGTSGLKFGGSVDLNGNDLNVSGSAGTFSVNITGSGNVTLSTTGTTRFEGTGTSYSGTTAVTAGKLLVSGTKSGSGNMTVSNSAVLGGSGSIAGNININNTATITGGDVGTFGKLTASGTGDVTLAATSTFRLDIGSNAGAPGTAGVHFDQIALTGSGKTIYLGSSNLVFSIAWPVAVNQAYKIIDATGNTVSGTFAGLNLGNNYEYSLPGTLNGVRFKINYGSDAVSLTFTAVPEPASLSLVTGAICLGMGRRNNSKKRRAC